MPEYFGLHIPRNTAATRPDNSFRIFNFLHILMSCSFTPSGIFEAKIEQINVISKKSITSKVLVPRQFGQYYFDKHLYYFCETSNKMSHENNARTGELCATSYAEGQVG
jgi:hypothetical protein